MKQASPLTKKFFICFCIIFAISLVGLLVYNTADWFSPKYDTKYKDANGNILQIQGNITDKKPVLQCLETLIKNFNATSSQDLTSYLETIPTSKRQETKQTIKQSWEKYHIQVSIISFKVQVQQGDLIRVLVEQKEVATWEKAGAEAYRPHVAQTNYEFKLFDNQWLINQMIVSDNFFI